MTRCHSLPDKPFPNMFPIKNLFISTCFSHQSLLSSHLQCMFTYSSNIYKYIQTHIHLLNTQYHNSKNVRVKQVMAFQLERKIIHDFFMTRYSHQIFLLSCVMPIAFRPCWEKRLAFPNWNAFLLLTRCHKNYVFLEWRYTNIFT